MTTNCVCGVQAMFFFISCTSRYLQLLQTFVNTVVHRATLRARKFCHDITIAFHVPPWRTCVMGRYHDHWITSNCLAQSTRNISFISMIVNTTNLILCSKDILTATGGWTVVLRVQRHAQQICWWSSMGEIPSTSNTRIQCGCSKLTSRIPPPNVSCCSGWFCRLIRRGCACLSFSSNEWTIFEFWFNVSYFG